MGKIWIITQREYISRVKRLSFLVTTLLAPLGFLVLIGGSAFIGNYSNAKSDIAVIDDSGLFRDIAFPDAADKTVYFHKLSSGYDELAREISGQKEEEQKYEAIIYIPANFNVSNPNNPVISYRYVKRPGVSTRSYINQRLTEAVREVQMKALNVNMEVQDQIQKKVAVEYSSLSNEEEKKGYAEAAGIAGLLMGFAIYISLFFYGAMIMKGVMEEKTNRIVEILTSSVKPFELMMGKILGVGAVGLTQFVLWFILLFVVDIVAGIVFGTSIAHSSPAVAAVNPGDVDTDEMRNVILNLSNLPFKLIFGLFPLYFVGGFLLYGSLFAAVGAAMGEDGDQQSLMLPLTVPIILSIFIAINVVNNPESPLGFWGSLIPFTSPIVMSTLLPYRPEWWQILISLVLLIAGFLLTTYIAGKIYKTGILMYGKKVKVRDIFTWIIKS